jgi:putative transposase
VAQKKSGSDGVGIGVVDQRRALVDWGHPELSLRRQCELLGLNRSTLYYRGAAESETNLCLMRLIDEQYLRTPFYGSRRMTVWLQGKEQAVNRKRVQRLMGVMGLQAIYPKPRLSQRDGDHRVYPYLLRGLKVERPNQVWAADITYIPMSQGFMYLVAVIDWYSRCVLSWRLSNSLESTFCVEALEDALTHQQPEIFNTDQGVQFTSRLFTDRLAQAGVSISMDGRGRALDNVFVERLWWSVKYEHVYLHDHQTVPALHHGLTNYLVFFNRERRHQSLEYHTPWDVYRGEHLVAGPAPRC